MTTIDIKLEARKKSADLEKAKDAVAESWDRKCKAEAWAMVLRLAEELEDAYLFALDRDAEEGSE